MKKILLMLGIIVFSMQFASAQKADTSKILSPQALHDFYMQRRNTYRTVGWVMFVPGVTMTIVGVAEAGENAFGGLGQAFGGTSANYDPHKGETVAYIGGGLVLASITSFIIAGHNKRKASLALKNGSIANGFGSRNVNYAAVCLKIKF